MKEMKTTGLTMAVAALIGCCCSLKALTADTHPAAAQSSPSNLQYSREDDIAVIMSRFQEQRHKSLRELRDLGTPEARAILLETALGQRGAGNEEWAAQCFLHGASPTSDARKLLAAKNPKVWCVAMRQMWRSRIPVDAELTRQVDRLLQSDDLEVRLNCARLLAFDSSADLGGEKAVALIRSLETVQRSPEFAAPIGSTHEIGAPWTMGGLVCETIIGTLGEASSVPLPLLEELTPEAPGLARDCVLVARARRHDASVRADMYRIMRESPVGKVRLAAVNIFCLVGNGKPTDAPELEAVAASDPLAVVLSAGDKLQYEAWNPGKEAPDRLYPIRDHARYALDLIREGVTQKGGRQ